MRARLRSAAPLPARPLSSGGRAWAALAGRAPDPATPAQIKSVLRRLEVLLGEAMEQGRRLGVEVTPGKLATLCTDLLREVQEPGFRPAHDGSVAGFFWDGLFAEMVQQPSNIFEEVRAPDGRLFYVPLTPELWAECLRTLRTLLQPGA